MLDIFKKKCSLFLCKQFMTSAPCCLLKHTGLILLTKIVFEFGWHSGISDCFGLKPCLTMMSLILHQSHYYRLVVMSWLCHNRAMLVIPAACQILCACMRALWIHNNIFISAGIKMSGIHCVIVEWLLSTGLGLVHIYMRNWLLCAASLY